MSTVFNFYLAEKMSQSCTIGTRGKNVSLTINNIKYVIKMFDVGCLINFIFTKINSLTYPREKFLCKSQITKFEFRYDFSYDFIEASRVSLSNYALVKFLPKDVIFPSMEIQMQKPRIQNMQI